MLPISSCLGVPIVIIEELRKTFADTPGLEQDISNIKLMTNWVTLLALNDFDYHATVKIKLDENCVVVDHASYPTAFKVPLHGYCNLRPDLGDSNIPTMGIDAVHTIIICRTTIGAMNYDIRDTLKEK